MDSTATAARSVKSEDRRRHDADTTPTRADTLWTRAEAHLSFTFTNNIVYFGSGNLFGGNWSGEGFEMRHNIYFDTRGSPSHPPLDGALKFADWRARGQDIQSLFADPLFVAPSEGDFRLKRASPALAFGFHPFDLREAGPRRKFTRP